MASEALRQAVIKITAQIRAGNLDDAYTGYRDMFAAADFLTYRPEDQRQPLRLMVYAKGVPSTPTPAMVEAHRAAVAPLSKLVSVYKQPPDHEMLGMCHVVLGNVQAAGSVFREGLDIERQRDPQSDLCASLLKRISLL